MWAVGRHVVYGAIVGTRHVVSGSQGHARVAVESEGVERTVVEESVDNGLLGLVGVVDTAARGDSRRVTGSLCGSLRASASRTTRASSVTFELKRDGDD